MRNLGRFFNFVHLGAAWALPLCALAGPADRPIIEAIEGDRIVLVVTASGNREGLRGTELNYGERVKTGPRASARVLFPDGSRLLIGRSTEMEIQKGKPGTEWTQLFSGEVRGIIKKPKNPPPPGSPPKFGIRTRSVVMGVRGTDFVFSLDGEKAATDLHTLEGTVEIARNESTLLAGEGELVHHGEYVKSKNGALEQPKPFDTEIYSKQLNARQPEFKNLAESAAEVATKAAAAAELAKAEPVTLPTAMGASDALGGLPPPVPVATLGAPSSEGVVAPTRFIGPDGKNSSDPMAGQDGKDRKDRKDRKDGKERSDARPGHESPSESTEPSFLRLARFQINGVFLHEQKRQTLDGEDYSFATTELSWAPTLNLPGPLSIRGLLGVFPLRGFERGDWFWAIEGAVLGSLQVLGPLRAEIGIGAEGWWLRRAGLGPTLQAQVAWEFSERARIERVFVGVEGFGRPKDPSVAYSLHDNPDGKVIVIQLKAGVAFQW